MLSSFDSVVAVLAREHDDVGLGGPLWSHAVT
jgi:hypothetical protein